MMFASDMSSNPDSANTSAWPSVETEMPPTVPPASSCMWAMAGLPCAATWGRSLAVARSRKWECTVSMFRSRIAASTTRMGVSSSSSGVPIGLNIGRSMGAVSGGVCIGQRVSYATPKRRVDNAERMCYDRIMRSSIQTHRARIAASYPSSTCPILSHSCHFSVPTLFKTCPMDVPAVARLATKRDTMLQNGHILRKTPPREAHRLRPSHETALTAKAPVAPASGQLPPLDRLPRAVLAF